MKRSSGFLGMIVLGFLACGGDAELSEVDACKETASVVCTKIWECVPKDQIDAKAFGNSLSDCKVLLQGTCTPSASACETGTKYNSGNARKCIDEFSRFSCKDFVDDNTAEPAVCKLVCEQQ